MPPLEELARGSVQAVTNAEELLDEAKLLYNKGHYARAWTLATLCYEELGKAMVISRLIYTDSSDIQGLKSFWKRFRSHPWKLGSPMLLRALYRADREKWTWLKKNLSELREAQQSVKEQSIYVDYRDGRFVLPSEEFMGPIPDARTQIRISDWTLQLLKSRFPSEKSVFEEFKQARAEARRAGFANIRYNDVAVLMKLMLISLQRHTKDSLAPIEST